MANKYWKGQYNGGTGIWDGSTAASFNWSSSSTSFLAATPPTALDTAIFDVNSADCSVVSGAVCNSFTLTATYIDRVTLNADLTVGGSTGLATVSGGTLTLNTFKLKCVSFLSSGTTASYTPDIIFTAGASIECSGSGSVFAIQTSNINFNGPAVVNINYTGSLATTVNLGSVAYAPPATVNFKSGTYPLTLSTNSIFRNINFTGFAGNLAATTITIEGVITIPSNSLMTHTGSSSASITFDGLPSSNINIGIPLNRNIVILGEAKLLSALTLGPTYGTVTLSDGVNYISGTLDLNGQALTCVKFAADFQAYLYFNGGVLNCTSSTTTAFNSNDWTIFTDSGTKTGTIAMSGSGAKSFLGGYTTYYCTLINSGAGALTILGQNTFNDLKATYLPSTIIMDWGAIQTFLNGFSLSGTAGNLVTLKTNLAGTATRLEKASGVISTSYLSIKDIDAGGGAAWYAPPSQGNLDAGGNIGWSFTLPATLINLASNSYATSSLVGAIYGETAIVSTALTTASASASINLLQSLDSVSTCYAFSAGNINSSLDLIADAFALPLLTGDIYSTIEISSTALSTATANGTVSVASALFYYYADADYAVDGYFLIDEAPLSSSSQVASFSAGSIDFNAFLFSNASAINNVEGDIDLSQALTTNAQVTSTALGNINSTLPISASAFAPTQATASIYLDMYISGQPTAQSTCLGGVDLTQTLLSNAQVNTSLAGAMYAKLGLSSYSHSQALSIARLTFPSLYVGDLTITSLTPIHSAISLTPIHDISSLTPIHDISSLTPLNYIGLFH